MSYVTQHRQISKKGWWESNLDKGKKYYMRSTWEMNYAHYLDWLKKKKEIKKWEYEPDTFWFNNIRRGTCSYLPDFKIYQNDGTVVYHEVKGYMDSKSATKIKRMAKYYPNIKLIVIQKEEYKSIMKWSRMFL